MYIIKQRYTCTWKFVVYVITCPCGLLYVGETTMEIRMRISKHKSTICTGQNDLPLPKHFNEQGHKISQLKFCIIDSVPPLRRGGIRQDRFLSWHKWYRWEMVSAISGPMSMGVPPRWYTRVEHVALIMLRVRNQFGCGYLYGVNLVLHPWNWGHWHMFTYSIIWVTIPMGLIICRFLNSEMNGLNKSS